MKRKNMKRIISYIGSITSIIANIVFITLLSGYLDTGDLNIESIKIEMPQEIDTQERIKRPEENNSLSALFQLLQKADNWSIYSAAYPNEFPNICYVRLEVKGNEYWLKRINQADIVTEIQKIISVFY